MAKFSYKMQNILDIKFKLENQAKTNFASAQAKLEEEKKFLQCLKNKRMEYEQEYKERLNSALNIRELNFYVQSIEISKEKIKQQLVQVVAAEKNVEAARAHLQEVVQERKTHEKLKEYAFDEYVKELNAAESKEVDELVSYSYGKAVSE